MPMEATPEMEQSAEKYWNERRFKSFSADPRTWQGVYAAMRAAAPAAPVVQAEQEPVAWIRKNGFRFIAEIEPQDGSEVPLYAAPPTHPDAVLVEALRNLLSDDDIRRLRRFQEICEDSDADGHDLPKEAMSRLERAGALRSCGFGRHETTRFGDAILAALSGKGATK